MLAVWLTLAVGCADKGDTGDPPDLVPDTGGGACEGGTAPVVEALWCENQGMQYYPDAGQEVPTLTLFADFADEDADLTSYITRITYDTEPDDAVGAEAGAFPESFNTYNAEDCMVPSLQLGTVIYLQGGQPLYETTYEWSLTVTDAHGLTSEPAFATCTTPDFTGEGEP